MPVTRRSQSRSRSASRSTSRRGQEDKSRSKSSKPKLDTFDKSLRGSEINKKRKVLKRNANARFYEPVRATRDLSSNLLHDAWNLHQYTPTSINKVQKCNPTGRKNDKCKRERNPITGFCELPKKCLGQDVYSPIIDKCVPTNYVHTSETVTDFVNQTLVPIQSKLKRGLPIDILEQKKRYGFMDYKTVEKQRK